MQEIAAGTQNYTTFNEIMDTIYKRFQEKSGPQWRQCYKALQLLEYLIKNGSERVVDNARDHIYELKALRNFHYVDDKGKDQGINVRNRAQEIQDLLANNDKIKEERKKAKENRNKYTGVASDGFGFGSGSGGNRYGGFGSDSYRTSGGFRDEDSRPATPNRFESTRTETTRTSESSDRATPAASTSGGASGNKIVIKMAGGSNGTTSAPPKTEANLLDVGTGGDDWGDFTTSTTSSSTGAKPSSGFGDFADFQSAPSKSSSQPAPLPTQSSFASFPTSFPAVSAPQPQPANAGFASFGNFSAPAGAAPTAQPVRQAAPAAGVDLLGDFGGGGGGGSGFGGGAAVAPVQSFGQQQKPAIAHPTSNDPFSKLVSLDATSLAGAGKKEEAAGPSLNSIGWSTPASAFGGAGGGPAMGGGGGEFAQFGAPMRPTAGFGAPGGQQQQQQQSFGTQQQSLF
ncbi:Epsin-3, clathrin recruitment and traffic between the Golgi and endosome [Rhizophlyctis rosea]|nr:Epsin-3, clathrin recruitment and traffic between the Golgi and endosome [Rhizophlyctis rosea]